MIENHTKSLLREGKTALGVWGLLSDPTTIEVAGIAGLDYVLVDMEHTARDIGTIEHMARAADVVGIDLIVRVPDNDAATIQHVLETGAHGIAVPKIDTAEEAARAVAAARYPLEGERGVCSMSRAARFGQLRPRYAEYVEQANRDLLVIGLIETATGVENIAEILAAGLEVAFVGRRDLSGSLGVHGAAEHPSVLAAQEKILAAVAARDGDAWAGLVPYRDADSGEWRTDGATFLAYRNDISHLMEAYQEGVRLFKGDGAAATDGVAVAAGRSAA
jgi:2-keto-3-deoxy-L-rhamnonate aldolase RhmA